MDYLGQSILSLSTSDPGTMAAIVALQEELAAVEQEVKSAETAIGILQTQYGSLNRELVATQNDVQAVTARVTALTSEISTLGAIGGDTVSVVLTAPVSVNEATLTVPTGSGEERYFYWFGYVPYNPSNPGNPFTLSTYAGGNFRVGTYGVIWTRPTDSQNLSAVFEIDALSTFFPNQLQTTYVNLKVEVRANPFVRANPLYDFVFNDRPFPHSSFQTWSMKRTITVPLKALDEFAEFVTFTIMSSDGGYIYGVGGNSYGMQHQLNVKRIQ